MRDADKRREPGTGRAGPGPVVSRGHAEAGPVPGRAAAALTGRGGLPAPGELAALQRAAGNAAVTAALAGPEHHEHGAGCGHAPPAPVQRSAVHEVLRGGGQALDDGVRGEMESRLGADFSTVRLHNDAVAQRSAAEVGARAYTSGEHIVLGSGGVDRHTLAHELTHVIQQRQGPVAGTDRGDGLHVSDPSDAFERAAEANATRALAGPVPGPQPIQRAAGPAASHGERIPAVQRAIAGAERTRVTDALKAGSRVMVAGPDGARGWLTAHGDQYRVQKSKRETVTVDAATLWQDYTLLGTVRDGEKLPLDLQPADLPRNTKTRVRNGPQVMDFDTSPAAFAHYSYDLLGGKGGNQRNNDHLTIENSLAATFARLKQQPGQLESDLLQRPRKMKPHFNQQLNEAGYADIDNINFRPAENLQRPRPLGDALDPAGELRADKNPAGRAADPLPVEQEVHLQSFLHYVDTAFRRLELGAGMRAEITGSIRTMRGRMGFEADKLYLNKAQRPDFARFVVLVTDLTGSRPIPPLLAQLAGNEARAELSEADLALIGKDLDPLLRQRIADTVTGGGTWTTEGNSPDLNAVRSAVVKHYWNTVVEWAKSP